MTETELKQLALDCVEDLLPRGRTYSPDVWVDFAMRFLAAIQERSEPVAVIDGNGHGEIYFPTDAMFYYWRDRNGTLLYTPPSFEQCSEGLNASEAVYGFAAWLTSREQKTVMSSSDDSAPIAELVKQFCEENDLPEVSSQWPSNLIHPNAAPQDKDLVTEYSGAECPVGAAPLPDEVKEMVERLREPCQMQCGGFECGECTEAADLIERLAANQVPEGWVAVPREPTEAMKLYICDCDVDPQKECKSRDINELYRAMIAAGERK